MVIGALLLGAELMVIEAEFFLVFIGVSALIVGATVLVLAWIPLWAQWLLFAGIALGATAARPALAGRRPARVRRPPVRDRWAR